jgi:alkyldihydroxyacetonephosphate synthase
MLSPRGWLETRRLPASGAGPDPNRLVIGSEGILGIISEAWMRIQLRPRFRATAAVTFETWDAGWEATRRIAQAKLWPANLRLLDPELARSSAGMGSGSALLIVGFESGELSQRSMVADAVSIAREAGGSVDDAEVRVEDGSERPTGRGGAVGAWREAFIPGASGGSLGGLAGLGVVAGTFETAVTWDRWPDLDAKVRSVTLDALRATCGGGSLNCRFTHVYPDGPAPYYTYVGARPQGLKAADAHNAVKQAASDAILACGGTITHHHAVGRLHRPWYDQERPDLFAQVLRAAKSTLDPGGILNPGVLIEP